MTPRDLAGCPLPELSLQHPATKKPMAIAARGSIGLRRCSDSRPLPNAPPRKSQQPDERKCISAIAADILKKTYLEEKKSNKMRRRKYRNVCWVRIRKRKSIWWWRRRERRWWDCLACWQVCGSLDSVLEFQVMGSRSMYTWSTKWHFPQLWF